MPHAVRVRRGAVHSDDQRNRDGPTDLPGHLQTTPAPAPAQVCMQHELVGVHRNKQRDRNGRADLPHLLQATAATSAKVRLQQ